MPIDVHLRLARYGAIAAAAAPAVADIQVYDGPPIPLDPSSGSVTLSLPGLSFDLLNSRSTERNSDWWGGGFNCCGWGTSKWGGTYCTSYRSSRNFSARSFFDLQLQCNTSIDGLRFLPTGASVGGLDCLDRTELCFVTFWSYENCYGAGAGSFGTCDLEAVYHVGFRTRGDFPDFEAYSGWIRIEGPRDGLRITRWAYEDDGGGILVGEEPISPCPSDLNGDRRVDGGDLGLLLGDFGSKGGDADLNGDGRIDGGDIGLLLSDWGDCD